MFRYTRSIGFLVACSAAAAAAPTAAQQVADLQVDPASMSLAVGERQVVMATPFSRGGDVLSTVKFNWSPSDPSVLRVEVDPTAPPGVANIVGVAAGTASVSVRVGTLTRTISVTVTGGLPGGAGTGTATILRIEPQQVYLFPLEDIQLRPVFLKDDGTPAAAVPLTWRSFRPEVAQVDATGKVVGVTQGAGAIEAASEGGLRSRISVQIAAAPWTFDRPVLSLSPLQSDTVHVIVPAQGNRHLDPRLFESWKSTDQSVVTVLPIGEVTAISAGHAEIVVTAFGQESRLPVTVHREVEELGYAPKGDTVIVPLGGTHRFKATAYAADNTPVPEAPIYWSVGDSSVLGYSTEDSLATGKKIGTTTLTVHGPRELEWTWAVNVVAAGLVLDHSRLGMGRSDLMTLRASFADSAGMALSPATDVTWTNSDPSVLQVDANGVLNPIKFGRAEVVASTPWGVADTALVFVQGEILVTSTREGAANIYAFERSNPGEFSQITDDPANDISPVYSPDGSRIAWATNRDGNYEIYVADADGGNARRVTSTPANETEPTWTPDGERIVYQSDGSGTQQAWIMGADGSGQVALTDAGANTDPAVSPDGSTVAFTSTRDGNFEIYLMDLDGSNQRNFTGSPPPLHERVPAWQNDSTLLFVREERSGNIPTFVVARRTLSGHEDVLTEPTLVVNDFAVSSSGDLLAVAVEAPSPSGGTARRMYLVPLDGGAPVEVPRQEDDEQLIRPAFRR